MLRITVPDGHENAREYATRVLFETFLGLEVEILQDNTPFYSIEMPNQKGKLLIPDVFFAAMGTDWLCRALSPNSPLEVFDTRVLQPTPVTVEPLLPILFGDKAVRFVQTDSECQLPIDIIGSAFYMLSRYEEAVSDSKDIHGRFPASASVAAREGFLERPIIDEYVEVLWSGLVSTWPSLVRKTRTGRTYVTCDVDCPYQFYLRSWKRSLRVVVGDLVKRRSVKAALATVGQYLQVRSGNLMADPFYEAVSWIMDTNEKHGHQASFYFIPEGSNPQFDQGYSLDDPVLQQMFEAIRDRGHRVGLHPSYESHYDQGRIVREAELLRKAMSNAGFEQELLGGRQHYLRWDIGTPARWEAAGMNYDSTLSFPEVAGFRAGTSHPFPMYDLVENRPLKLIQRPLIAAESIIVSDVYMGMGTTEVALNYFKELRQRCYLFGGEFTLLWHNSSFTQLPERQFYEELLESA
ncbi:polysaccharide deacetylase family protein [Marivivens sp. LCG002]|uniref:polysaccharide deacetylase family protein n=1 Tax=Marivivens sp. LCG002 TaxID=3051171 RepID=UPI002552BF18|nr:polysaccharide deacetylase family protein [Marivivens sp. LCG002]WIV51407.1 polysaccharide deacetylase family protein [Marivivens sp. LCG002]